MIREVHRFNQRLAFAGQPNGSAAFLFWPLDDEPLMLGHCARASAHSKKEQVLNATATFVGLLYRTGES